MHQRSPEQSLQEMRQSLKDALSLEVSRSTISGFFRRVGEPIVWPRLQEPVRVTTSGGGFEILAALALHLGWVQHTAEVIGKAVGQFRHTQIYRQQRVDKDRKGRHAGRFTAAYNQREDIREQRFASVEEKREGKNYSRMALFQTSSFITGRKCLGDLGFPPDYPKRRHAFGQRSLGQCPGTLLRFQLPTWQVGQILTGTEVLGFVGNSAAGSGGILAGTLAEAGREQ
jgi:hypothetical protein